MNRLQDEQRILIFGGIASILIGLILGWVLGIAVLHDWGFSSDIRAVHMIALETGFLLILYGLLSPFCGFSDRKRRLWAILLTVGAYVFYVPAILGIVWGVEGDSWTEDLGNNLVFVLGIIGTLLVSITIPVYSWGIVKPGKAR